MKWKSQHWKEKKGPTVRREFRAKKVCIDILEEVMKRVKNYRIEETVSTWLVNISDKALEIGDINDLAKQVTEYGPDARNNLELMLKGSRGQRKRMQPTYCWRKRAEN